MQPSWYRPLTAADMQRLQESMDRLRTENPDLWKAINHENPAEDRVARPPRPPRT